MTTRQWELQNSFNTKEPRHSEPNIEYNKVIGKLSKQPPGIDSKQIVNILKYW